MTGARRIWTSAACLGLMLVMLPSIMGCSEGEGRTLTVLTETDIYYVPGSTFHKHTLDVYWPEEMSDCPVVLFVPGGAWRQGDKDKYQELGTLLAKHYGIVVAVTNYRLSNGDDGSAVHPDHVEDIAKAFAWVKATIQTYHGDPDNIYLFGQSAGAHLVSLLSTDSTWLGNEGYSLADIQGTVAMSGSYFLNDLVQFPMNPSGLSAEEVLMYKVIFLDAFGSWEKSVLDGASPGLYVGAAMPRFLIIDSEQDMPGFNAQAADFADAVSSTGRGEYHYLKVSDYSAATWSTATELAAAEPMFEDYVGHYAEVVAINETDRESIPTSWIVNFIYKGTSTPD